MADGREDKFWGRAPAFAPEFASEALARWKGHQDRLKSSRLHFRMRNSWLMYYSRSSDSGCDEAEINTAGERGELIKLSPNRYWRLIQDQLGLGQQTPPDYQPEAINTDPEAQAQCSLALGILDEYKRKKHLEELRYEAAEVASVLSASYRHIRWDPNAGKEAMPGPDAPPDPNADPSAPAPEPKSVFEGDHVITVRTPYEVAYDKNSPNKRRPTYWIVRDPMNKWDLLSEYGNDSEAIFNAIMGMPKWSAFTREWNYEQEEDPFDDTVGPFWVYFEKCPALPEGRKALCCDDGKTVLLDGPLDEDRAPVFRLSQADVIFRSEPHTGNFNGMPLCQAYKSQMSMIATNHDMGGHTRVAAARSSNVDVHALGTGLSVVDFDSYDPVTGQPVPAPTPFNLLPPQEEHVMFLDVLKAEIDTQMGGSPVTRGDPAATKGDSGSKAAMLFAAAQNIGGGFVRAMLRSDEEVATHIISSLRRHATVERITSILGENSTYTATRFTGEKLSKVSRVNVRQANPARDTFQGRMALSELLADKSPEQQEKIMGFVNTGRMETDTDDIETVRLLKKREDEALRNPGMPVPPTMDSDQHRDHIFDHLRQKNDPAIRSNPALVARIDKHCAEHIGRLTPDHPLFAGMPVLALTGQTPLPPMSAPPPMAGAQHVDQAAGASPGGPGAPPSDPSGAGPSADTGQPHMPSMPTVPSTGQKLDLPVPQASNVGGAQ